MGEEEIAGIEPIAQPTRGYWPQLDGVRALAIFLVLAVHSDNRWTGGILGVDLFFALSGFLITTLLLRERVSTGRIRIGYFYARRALRLVPALIVALLLIALINRLPGSMPTDLVIGIPSVVFYATNWSIIGWGNRLGTVSPYWSLAIEEQFYLVWPWVIRRWAEARLLAEAFLVIGVTVVGVRTFWILLHLRGGEEITVLRFDGLLFGAAVAVTLERGETLGRRVLGAAWLAPGAVLCIVVAVTAVVVHDTSLVRSLAYGMVGAGGAALIGAIVVSPGSPIARVLRARALVVIGRVSYGIYLFNYPIFTWAQGQHWSWSTTIVVEFLLTAVVTLGSWWLVERPALRLRSRFT